MKRVLYQLSILEGLLGYIYIWSISNKVHSKKRYINIHTCIDNKNVNINAFYLFSPIITTCIAILSGGQVLVWWDILQIQQGFSRVVWRRCICKESSSSWTKRYLSLGVVSSWWLSFLLSFLYHVIIITSLSTIYILGLNATVSFLLNTELHFPLSGLFTYKGRCITATACLPIDKKTLVRTYTIIISGVDITLYVIVKYMYSFRIIDSILMIIYI